MPSIAHRLAERRANQMPPTVVSESAPSPSIAQRLAERRAARSQYDPTADMGVIEKGLVGLGRGFVDFGEGVKQTAISVGEKLGLADEGAAQQYAESVRDERELFDKHLADPLGPIPLPRLQQTVKALADEQAAIPDVTGSRAGASKLLEQLDQLSNAGRLNFSQLRAVRSDLGKSLRELERSTTEGRFERLRLLQRAKAAVTKDLDQFAGRSNSGRLKRAWQSADRFYRDKVVPQRARDIQHAANNLNPDEAYNAFIKAGTNQDRAKRLYTALDRNGREAVRYGIVKDAYQKALREGFEGEVFSPAKFAGQLERLGG